MINKNIIRKCMFIILLLGMFFVVVDDVYAVEFWCVPWTTVSGTKYCRTYNQEPPSPHPNLENKLCNCVKEPHGSSGVIGQCYTIEDCNKMDPSSLNELIDGSKEKVNIGKHLYRDDLVTGKKPDLYREFVWSVRCRDENTRCEVKRIDGTLLWQCGGVYGCNVNEICVASRSLGKHTADCKLVNDVLFDCSDSNPCPSGWECKGRICVSILDSIEIIQDPESPSYDPISGKSDSVGIFFRSEQRNFKVDWSVSDPCKLPGTQGDSGGTVFIPSSEKNLDNPSCVLTLKFSTDTASRTKTHRINFVSKDIPEEKPGTTTSPTLHSGTHRLAKNIDLKIAGDEHTLTITAGDEESITVRIASEPKEKSISKGTRVDFEFDDVTITVTYNGITERGEFDITVVETPKPTQEEQTSELKCDVDTNSGWNCEKMKDGETHVSFQERCDFTEGLDLCSVEGEFCCKSIESHYLDCDSAADGKVCICASQDNKLVRDKSECVAYCDNVDDPEKECFCESQNTILPKSECIVNCRDCFNYYRNCYCPAHCNNFDFQLGSTSATCGGIDPTVTCRSAGGECMTQEQCTQRHDQEDANYISSENINAQDCSEDQVCCNLKTGKNTTLHDCGDICHEPDGCYCKDICRSRAGSNLSNFNNNLVPRDFNCLGHHMSDPLRATRCNNEERDGICPPGCFWWNDLDCGRDSNIISLLWDIAPESWKSWYYDGAFVETVTSLGVMFDINHWAETICNPINRRNLDPKEDGYFVSHDTSGWISGLVEPYNETHLVYTKSYYINNLNQDNKFRIEIRGNNILYKYPRNTTANVTFSNNDYWFNISRGDTIQEADIAFFHERELNRICMIFEEDVVFNKNLAVETSVKEICRYLNVIW